MTLSGEDRRAWITLARTDRVGPITFRDLLRHFGSPADALDALPRLARRGGGRLSNLTIPAPDEVTAELEALQALGGRMILACDADFPPRLAALDPQPPLIAVLGQADLNPARSVAIVGARAASALGRRFAQDMATNLGAQGVTVVSGLARGIDAAAHHGALATGTLAVVAGGLDIIYPPEHGDLHADIARSGAIITERRLGLRPTSRDFPRRNRLISGLADAVLVVEAAKRSGSLITARMAAEQGREVLAVPGHPADPRAAGPNALIKDGAGVVETADDVLAALSAPRTLSATPDLFAVDPPTQIGAPAPDAEPAQTLTDQVFAALSVTPMRRDDVMRAIDAPTAAVAAALIELELAGRVIQSVDGLVSISPPS